MVIADTGLSFAVSNRKDACHQRAVGAVEALGHERLIVTWPVMTETCCLLRDRLGPIAQARSLASHGAGAFDIADPGIHLAPG